MKFTSKNSIFVYPLTIFTFGFQFIPGSKMDNQQQISLNSMDSEIATERKNNSNYSDKLADYAYSISSTATPYRFSLPLCALALSSKRIPFRAGSRFFSSLPINTSSQLRINFLKSITKRYTASSTRDINSDLNLQIQQKERILNLTTLINNYFAELPKRKGHDEYAYLYRHLIKSLDIAQNSIKKTDTTLNIKYITSSLADFEIKTIEEKEIILNLILSLKNYFESLALDRANVECFGQKMPTSEEIEHNSNIYSQLMKEINKTKDLIIQPESIEGLNSTVLDHAKKKADKPDLPTVHSFCITVLAKEKFESEITIALWQKNLKIIPLLIGIQFDKKLPNTFRCNRFDMQTFSNWREE